ncbi:50S ribosomal protein L11 [Candidatus Woesearchaeota archaeon]|nr:50S ribosomal protein L11 [Candidatus Woesearchaeota archaeon]
MAKETVEVLIEGGKATAAPPLGPALGPLGVNIGLVVSEINKKTADFKGMKVPVKVTVDKDTKTFDIKIGTPPAAELIKKEAGIPKGSGMPNREKVADLAIEQVIKVAKMKSDVLLGKDMKQKVKEIVGTCQSMGILVESLTAQEAIKAINEGKFDSEILSGKTEISAEEMKKLQEEKQHLQEEMKKHHEEALKKAKDIVASLAGKDNKIIRKRLVEDGIPESVINEVAPEGKEKK